MAMWCYGAVMLLLLLQLDDELLLDNSYGVQQLRAEYAQRKVAVKQAGIDTASGTQAHSNVGRVVEYPCTALQHCLAGHEQEC